MWWSAHKASDDRPTMSFVGNALPWRALRWQVLRWSILGDPCIGAPAIVPSPLSVMKRPGSNFGRYGTNGCHSVRVATGSWLFFTTSGSLPEMMGTGMAPSARRSRLAPANAAGAVALLTQAQTFALPHTCKAQPMAEPDGRGRPAREWCLG